MASSFSNDEIVDLWRRFLIDVEFANNYHQLYGFDLFSIAARNPVVEQFLPSLLHVKAVAILDHGIKAYLSENNLKPPRRRYKSDLNGRICYCEDNSLIKDSESLHRIRELRNDLGHEPDETTNWATLYRDVAAINAAFKELSISGDLPVYNFIASKSEAQEATEPDAKWSVEYELRVEENGKPVASKKFTMNHF